MRYRFGILGVLALVAACSQPVSERGAAMSAAEREAVTDTVLALSRAVMATGEALDPGAMAAWFRDGSGAAFGAASGVAVSTDDLRTNLEAAYGRLDAQEFNSVGERVAVLGPDAAVVTGLGAYAMQDTIGNKALGNQAYTFVWALHEGEWGIVQAHFSSQLAGVEPAGGEEEGNF